MAGRISSNRRTAVVLLLAMVVLVGAILAVLIHDDDGKRTETLPTPTTPPTVSTSRPTSTTTPRSTTTSSLKDLPGTGSTTTAPPTTVEPAVPTPEQAATGLFAAYRAGDQAQAATFATEDVIAVMFAQPYAPPDGSFRGCRPDGELYQCSYVQGTSTYDMTAQRHPDTGSFLIVVITVFRPSTEATTTTTTVPPSG